MIKKITLSILLTLLVCFQSIATEKPKINNFRDKVYVNTISVSNFYNRKMNENIEFLNKYKKTIKYLPNNLVFTLYEEEKFIKAIYFLNSDTTIGYSLLEFIELPKNVHNDLIVKSIKSLKEDFNYLKNDLKMFKGLEVKFYFNETNNFVERYAFLKISNQKLGNILLMESFYPKNLESQIKPYIIESLNKELASFNK
jgi:hypothetical protein